MELQERMKITVEGQLTWASPELNQKCENCRHFKLDPKKPPMGKCALVQIHTKKAGKSFLGQIAIACSKFDR